MSLRNTQTSYTRLSQHDDGFIDAQFKSPPRRIPWKSIWYAAAMFVAGTILILVSLLLLMGHIDEKYGDRTYPFLIIGILMFIPGAYHIHVAVSAYRGHEGYSFDDIPFYDDDYAD